jgi:hypothetical protein
VIHHPLSVEVFASNSGLIDEKDSKESVFTESPKNGWLCSKYTLLSPIRLFRLQSNAVGFGAILGFGYHANFSKNNEFDRALPTLCWPFYLEHLPSL